MSSEEEGKTVSPEIEYDEFGFVKGYICPRCNGKLNLHHEDDVGTKFFKCEKCGQQTAKPKSEERKQLEKSLEKHFEPSLTPKYYPNYEDFLDPETHAFKPAKVGDWIKENEHFKTDRKTGILFYYNESKGKWEQNGEDYLQEIVAKILGAENRVSHYNNILHHVKSITKEDLVFSKKLAAENGLLNVETKELTAFTPEEMPFYSIAAAYNPKAECPNWLKFIKQVVSPEDAPALQEWSGYLLLPDYPEHKIAWLHGAGRNGKGVWQRTMEGILGEESCSSVGLEEFDGNHRFAMRQLYGSLFNCCSEPTTNKTLQTALLKKATGQDTINAECKGKDKRIKFRNVAKITVIANMFPKVADRTVAFRERRLFIKFPNEFTGKDKTANLERVWLENPEEKSGILNWMLEGLQRLLSQGGFTESKSQRETEIEFQRASDTIGAFITEMGTYGANYEVTRTEAYERYKGYCDFIGATPESDKAFTQRMKETPKVKDTSTRVEGKKTRVWKGIMFRRLEDLESGTLGTLGTHFTSFYTTPNLEDTKYKEEDTKYKEDTPRYKQYKTHVKSVPSVPAVPAAADSLANAERTCGQCALWHKGGCSFPDDPSCVAPTSLFARDCRSFMVNGMVQHG